MADSLHQLASGAVLHQGPGTGAPVLFLHGVGGAAWSWAPQLEVLGASFSTFTWEARGHGSAAPVPDAGLADSWVDAREALLFVREQTGRPAVVVGHSMGGLLAMALACELPDAVAGVFLVDPVYAEAGTLPVAIPRVVTWGLRLVVSAVAKSFQVDGWLGRAVAWPIFSWAFHDRAARDRTWPLQRQQVPLEHPRMLLESVDGVAGFPFSPFADRVKAPVHLVEALMRPGSRSKFETVKPRLQATLGARATFQSVVGGHYLQLDRPGEVNVQLLQFLQG
jgi:pimeloyl-ACP methyl ester carboxylesterase